MDFYAAWSDNRPKIPPGEYDLLCQKAEKCKIWHEGQTSWGRSEKIVLWFQVFGGEHSGVILPMFLPLGENGQIRQGSKYFDSWCIANDGNRPPRSRLKEMPLSKFEKKVFRGDVLTVRPKWKNGKEKPLFSHYSRVDVIYELVAGNPNV